MTYINSAVQLKSSGKKPSASAGFLGFGPIGVGQQGENLEEKLNDVMDKIYDAKGDRDVYLENVQ